MRFSLTPPTYAIFRHLAVGPRTKHELSTLTGLNLRAIGGRVRVLEEESLVSHTHKLYFITDKGIDAMNSPQRAPIHNQ